MGILHTLNSEFYEVGLGKGLPPTAGKGSVEWAEFVVTESHAIFS